MNPTTLLHYNLALPIALSEVGGRNTNEDAVYPSVGSATTADRVFVVCDGMCGLAKGQEASQLVSQRQ